MHTKRFEYRTYDAVSCDGPCGCLSIRGATVELRTLNDEGRAVGSTYYCADCAPPSAAESLAILRAADVSPLPKLSAHWDIW
jgi:hypothetical protein